MIILKINNFAHLGSLTHLPAGVVGQVKERLTFATPAYLEAQKRGFSTWNIPQQIQGYRVEADALIIPRGFTRQLIGILKNAAIRYRLEDRRRALPEVEFQFLGEFRDYQEEAAAAVLTRDFGTLAAPTGAGKTVMALGLAQ